MVERERRLAHSACRGSWRRRGCAFSTVPTDVKVVVGTAVAHQRITPRWHLRTRAVRSWGAKIEDARVAATAVLPALRGRRT
jgi:hypothetical protein